MPSPEAAHNSKPISTLGTGGLICIPVFPSEPSGWLISALGLLDLAELWRREYPGLRDPTRNIHSPQNLYHQDLGEETVEAQARETRNHSHGFLERDERAGQGGQEPPNKQRVLEQVCLTGVCGGK